MVLDVCAWFQLVFAGLAWLQVVLYDCSLFWQVSGGCGQFWLVLGDRGLFWLLVCFITNISALPIHETEQLPLSVFNEEIQKTQHKKQKNPENTKNSCLIINIGNISNSYGLPNLIKIVFDIMTGKSKKDDCRIKRKNIPLTIFLKILTVMFFAKQSSIVYKKYTST